MVVYSGGGGMHKIEKPNFQLDFAKLHIVGLLWEIAAPFYVPREEWFSLQEYIKTYESSSPMYVGVCFILKK